MDGLEWIAVVLAGGLVALAFYLAYSYVKEVHRQADTWQGVALQLMKAADLATENIERERGIRPDRIQQRNQTKNWLVLYFDKDGLASLLFDFGLDYDNIGGETLEAKAREIVEYFDRRGELGQLRAAIKKSRPNIKEGA